MAPKSFYERACERIDAEFGVLSQDARGTIKSLLEAGMRDAHARGTAALVQPGEAQAPSGVPSQVAKQQPEEDQVAATLMLLEEAISICRREGVAGQHIGAMCSARDDLRGLSALVRDMLSPDPCLLDHHGHCHQHRWFEADRACPHARAKEMGLTCGN